MASPLSALHMNASAAYKIQVVILEMFDPNKNCSFMNWKRRVQDSGGNIGDVRVKMLCRFLRRL